MTDHESWKSCCPSQLGDGLTVLVWTTSRLYPINFALVRPGEAFTKFAVSMTSQAPYKAIASPPVINRIRMVLTTKAIRVSRVIYGQMRIIFRALESLPMRIPFLYEVVFLVDFT